MRKTLLVVVGLLCLAYAGNARVVKTGRDLEARQLTGNLIGDVTGNVTGSAGSATGNAATATALAANPADCSANQFANAIAASGALTCAAVGNAATTAASANTASAIVTRDASGNFSATKVSASSSTTSGNPSGYLGVWATTPTAHNIGDTYFDTYHNAIAVSTATFAASASGWLWSTVVAGTAVWTTYE
jgi:hypothetical protein